MAISVTHTFVSPVADDSVPGEVGPAEWNAAHTLTGIPDAGGTNTQVQFNDSGVLGGDAGLVYSKTTDVLTVGNIVTNGTITSAGHVSIPANPAANQAVRKDYVDAADAALNIGNRLLKTSDAVTGAATHDFHNIRAANCLSAGPFNVYMTPRFNVSHATHGWPPASGSSDPALKARLDTGNVSLDFGSQNNGVQWCNWIQSRDASRFDLNYNILLNPNGGQVAVNTLTPTAGYALTVAGSTHTTGNLAASGSITATGNIDAANTIVGNTSYAHSHLGIRGWNSYFTPALHTYFAAHSLPITSGTADPACHVRFNNADVSMDFGAGTNGAIYLHWIQCRRASNCAVNDGLLLNPNGGQVSINTTITPYSLSVGGDIMSYRPANPAPASDGIVRFGSSGLNYLYSNAGKYYLSSQGLALDTGLYVGQGNAAPAFPLAVRCFNDSNLLLSNQAGFPTLGIIANNFGTWGDLFIAGGTSMKPLTDGAISCGNAARRWSSLWAVTGTIQTSDARSKKDVADSDLGLDFINTLRPVSYKWIIGRNLPTRVQDYEVQVPASVDADGNPIPASSYWMYKDEPTPVPGVRTHYGLIAQEVALSVQAAGVVDFGGYVNPTLEKDADPNLELGLRYDEFIAPMIKAIQELSAKVTALEAQLAALT